MFDSFNFRQASVLLVQFPRLCRLSLPSSWKLFPAPLSNFGTLPSAFRPTLWKTLPSSGFHAILSAVYRWLHLH